MWNFTPILKQTIWGGDRILRFKGLSSPSETIGESWELSSVPGSESVVADGPEAGLTLTALLDKYGPAIVGERNHKRYGNRFPLLIKFIDACQNLSVQVHPGDELARKMGQENGKTEMWFVVDAGKNGHLASGFREPVNPGDYEALLEDGSIEEKLNVLSVQDGDAFYIPAGRVHSIGAGTFLVEIQQTSDATFRIYDYHRKGPDGRERQLHTEQARQAIDFNDIHGAPISYVPHWDIPVNLVKSPYFTVNILNLGHEVMRDYSELDSFVALVVTEGRGELQCGADKVSDVPTSMKIKKGDTILVSASAKGLTIVPESGPLTILETFVA